MASDFAVGLVACMVSSLCFGTMFVTIRPYKTGDGFFVQWVMGVSIFMVGLVVNMFESFSIGNAFQSPTFYPLAMIGGLLWATGNITAVPIINSIGMTVGILLWSTTNLLCGWASGRFGWFNTKPEVPGSDFLNLLGLIFSLISTVMFAFVQNKPISNDAGSETRTRTSPPPRLHANSDDTAPLLSDPAITSSGEGDEDYINNALSPRIRSRATSQQSNSEDQPMASEDTKKRLFGIGLSLIAGCFYGLCFAPVIYIQDNYEGASQSGLPYVFAHYSGILASSTVYFIIYCAFKQNRPFINKKVILPAMITGVLWAIAQASWFIANRKLSEAISFPIITRFPGVVAAIWGVFYFKEIRGRKNLQLLFVAIIITVVGGVLSGLSKIIKDDIIHL